MNVKKVGDDMRVISGTAKGRPLKAVPGMTTRPTTDKVKEAMFSMIGPYFEGGLVLDLFAGSGGLSIEALSRGAERAVLIDAHPSSVQTIKRNLADTGLLDHAEVFRNDAFRAIRALQKRQMMFDYVFLDPPYHLRNIPELIESLDQAGLLSQQALVICEHAAADRWSDSIARLHSIKYTTYGDTALSIYQKSEEAPS
jgi:16S rRNA (guanine(966)-N(2))-methyltransferase RsmD